MIVISSIFLEHATDGSMASENWALNLEICDAINMSEDGYVVILGSSWLLAAIGKQRVSQLRFLQYSCLSAYCRHVIAKRNKHVNNTSNKT